MPLSLTSSFTPCAPAHDAHVLGGFCIAADAPPAPPAWPRQRLATRVPGTREVWHEWWSAGPGAELVAGESEGVRWRRHGALLFGVVDIDEAGLSGTGPRTPLEQAAHDAYARIFRLLDAQGLPHLWRVWNHMADIHGEAQGLERYRQFNIGRGDAFEAASRSVAGQVPAACVLGLPEGPLTVAFMAGATPIVPIENPRQVSAFHYPERYGPRSPTFARAALAHPPGQEILFLSGTASIVGHASVHLGDVVAQTGECVDNVSAVLAQASVRSRTGPYALADLAYRAYVRHAADVPAVQAVLNARLGGAPVVCVLADVCRAELLVEIEGQCIR